jgi:hypothetical protein
MEENYPKIPPLEHVDHLLAVDQSKQEKQKQGYSRSKQKRHKDDMEEILKEEEQQRQARDDGHVDYHA